VTDRAALLARRIGEGDHEIEGVGTVRFRGLSRAEVLALQQVTDPAAADRQMVAWALVDPALSVEDVKTWQENSAAHEIEGLTLAIAELSKMGPGAAKSGVSSVRD
jgi:hypothetical protein